MNPRIARLVEDGHRLRSQKLAIEAGLKEIEGNLKDLALAHPEQHEPLKDEGSQGTQWIAVGEEGHIARVVCPQDKLKASIRPESKEGQKILAAAGSDLDFLFDRQEVLVPRPDIRKRLGESGVSKSAQEKIIKSATGDSAPSIKWEVVP
jgi:hypothetical protein